MQIVAAGWQSLPCGDFLKVFIDLFSGLGGAARAFDESPEWTTIKIDNKEELIEHNRGLILLDISNVHETLRIINAYLDNLAPTKLVVWASPPCEQFSFANAARNEEDFDMTLFDAAVQIIKTLDPDHWIIENVRGARSVFSEELGLQPTQEIGSVILWGHFPLIPIEARDAFAHKKMSAKGSRVLRPNYRALIPYQISLGLRDAIDHQRTLTSFF